MRWELEVFLALLPTVVASLSLYFYNILWLRPERVRGKLRRQGIHGPAPSFFYGNIPDMKMIQEEQKKSRGGAAAALTANYAYALFPYLDRWKREYGQLYMYATGSIQTLSVARQDLVKEISLCKSLDLGKPTHLQRDRGALLGRGILSANGPSWAHQRSVIAPKLYMDKVKGMVELMIEAAVSLLKSWENIVNTQGETELVVDASLRSFSADVISRACFGSNYSQGKGMFSKLRQLQMAMSKRSLLIGIPGSRYLPTKNNREIWRLDNEIRSLILDMVKERKSSSSDSLQKDLLQSIIKGAAAGHESETDFIVDNCKNIYFAGHDTVSQTAAWCLMLLGSHPEWQARAREEILEVCQGRVPDMGMFRKMKILTMVIQETLRLYSPVAFVTREALQDMKLGDVDIPKSVVMQIAVPNLNHDQDNWGSDADEFNPGRFMHGIAGACKFPHMYMPFGIGTRTCAGQNFAMVELKVLLSLLLSKFIFSLSPNYVHSPSFSLTIEPQFGVPLIFKSMVH